MNPSSLRERRLPAFIHAPLLLLAVITVAFFFAHVEIEIEGSVGWAGSLPTWRVESHWLLEIFWGGRPLTGYHAWVFSFMALAFHLPLAVVGRWSVRLQARILGCLALFWISEDLLWFIMNPAFGWSQLDPAHVPWHRSWFAGLPTDYWTFSLVGGGLFALSFWFRARSAPSTEHAEDS